MLVTRSLTGRAVITSVSSGGRWQRDDLRAVLTLQTPGVTSESRTWWRAGDLHSLGCS